MSEMLQRLINQQGEAVTFVDELLDQAQREGRDLVRAELDNVAAHRARIDELEEQITPLREYDERRNRAAQNQNNALARRDGTPPITGSAPGAPAASIYRTVGQFLSDLVRSRDEQVAPALRQAAAERIARQRAVDNQTTVDTPGLLPVPVVGTLLNYVDASRPLITSLGPIDMSGIPGKTFNRPKVTQQPLVGKQAAEKTQVASRKMIIGDVPMAKETHAGVVDISRQDIDWTSPTAWDILIQGLMDAYAIDTETTVAAAFAAAVTQSHEAATMDLAGLAAAMYLAAADVYAGVKVLPDRIWLSLDMWATFGPIVDVLGRLTFGPTGGPGGQSSITSFNGNMLDVPRIVVPALPTGTMIVGSTRAYEFYEQRIGILSAVEPSLLGVEVAYGGYIAFGAVEPLGLSKVTAPPPLP
jgi:hypothetical protein